MGRRRQRLPGTRLSDRRQASAAKRETAFRAHLVTFLASGFFLLTLNLLTDPTSLWFYWPLFFWAWAIIIHAFAIYGVGAPWRVLAIIRSLVPRFRSTSAFPDSAGRDAPLWSSPHVLDLVEERVQRLWRIARQFPEGPTRNQAFRISAAADRVAEVMAVDHTDPGTVRWFNDRLLAPTETMMSQYLQLSSRDVPGAHSTLRRVENESLPAIEARLDALYDQLHRGAVVDLAVASEMLEFELPDRRMMG